MGAYLREYENSAPILEETDEESKADSPEHQGGGEEWDCDADLGTEALRIVQDHHGSGPWNCGRQTVGAALHVVEHNRSEEDGDEADHDAQDVNPPEVVLVI